MKILVVDDSKAMRMIVIRTLKKAGFSGHTTLEASSVAEALEVVESESPNLILSDWNMPEANGIELLKQLREAGNPVRFGFVTSEASSETKQLGEEAGAEFFLTKPFTPEAMQVALDPILT